MRSPDPLYNAVLEAGCSVAFDISHTSLGSSWKKSGLQMLSPFTFVPNKDLAGGTGKKRWIRNFRAYLNRRSSSFPTIAHLSIIFFKVGNFNSCSIILIL